MHKELIKIDRARAILAGELFPLTVQVKDLNSSLGCRLAEAIHADISFPQYPVSAMDGFAVRHRELVTGDPQPVAFEIPAGTVPAKLPAGCAARIFTGAMLPEGADTVVQQEKAEPSADGRVRLGPLPSGTNVRQAGEIFKSGETLLQAGELVTPQMVALLAAAGADRLQVYPRPRLSIILSGSELIPAGEKPRPGQVRDSNSPMLQALAESSRFQLTGITRVADELEPLEELIKHLAGETDILVTSGGVSVGKYDFIPLALEKLGARILFHGVSMKPGKPLLVASYGSCWIVGLPGNPFSALVGWRMFIQPMGETLAGSPWALTEKPLYHHLISKLENKGKRTLFLPARRLPDSFSGEVEPLPWKGSHDLRTAALADILIRLEPGETKTAGEDVACYAL